MWGFFIKRNRFSYLLLVAILGAGVYSLINIPRESTPEVQVPVGIVTTVLPGAPATEVESLVTNTLERGLIGSLKTSTRLPLDRLKECLRLRSSLMLVQT